MSVIFIIWTFASNISRFLNLMCSLTWGLRWSLDFWNSIGLFQCCVFTSVILRVLKTNLSVLYAPWIATQHWTQCLVLHCLCLDLGEDPVRNTRWEKTEGPQQKPNQVPLGASEALLTTSLVAWRHLPLSQICLALEKKCRDFFSPGIHPDIAKSVFFPMLRKKRGQIFCWMGDWLRPWDFQLGRVFLVIHKFIPEFSVKQSVGYSIWIKGFLRFTPKWQFGAHKESLHHPFKTASLSHLCPLGGRSI